MATDALTCAPCGACCLRSWPVPVRPTDTVPSDLVEAGRMRRAPDGSCIAYRGGCTIYLDRPEACRRIDVGGRLCQSARRWKESA